MDRPAESKTIEDLRECLFRHDTSKGETRNAYYSDSEAEIIGHAIQSVIRGEEWAFHDSETPWNCSEYSDIQELINNTEAFYNLASEQDPETVWAVWSHNSEWTAEEVTRAFEDGFRGVHSSPQEFAFYWLEDVQGHDPGEFPYNYFDHESWLRDLGYEGWEFIKVPQGVAVFSPY